MPYAFYPSMLLTKSKYMAGLCCPKYLWMMFHDLDKIPPLSLATEHVIAQGNAVGKLACTLFADGVYVSEEGKDFALNIKQTQALLAARKTIFEGGIVCGELYARADILVPVGDDAWDVIEVKASMRVKDEHVHDLSFQKYVYEQSGLSIRNCYLMHINKNYVHTGDFDAAAFFVQADVTSAVAAIDGVASRIADMMDIVNDATPPEVSLGNGCGNGFNCVSEDCWSFLPEGHVFELYRGGKKSYELLEAEVLCLQDIPDAFKLNGKQQIQKKCALSGEVHVNADGLRTFLDRLVYPLYYLDFETFQTAVPLYAGTTPYQQIPFQFSLHVDSGSSVEHFEFLSSSALDPREAFLVALQSRLGDSGSVVVYYQSFEISRLRELGLAFPAYSDWVESVIARMVDLIVPFSNFDYYNPLQKGSCSLKAVLPALVDRDYSGLAIAKGDAAAAAYYDSVILGNSDVRSDLLAYCELDTEAMIWIVGALRELCRKL